MSMAPRDANAKSHSTFCEGQPRLFGHRQYASPSLRTSAVPQEGQALGNLQGLELLSRFEGTGATTSGMTSPARRTITVSFSRTSLRRTSSSLCSVALEIVTPPTETGSGVGEGGPRPVPP